MHECSYDLLITIKWNFGITMPQSGFRRPTEYSHTRASREGLSFRLQSSSNYNERGICIESITRSVYLNLNNFINKRIIYLRF